MRCENCRWWDSSSSNHQNEDSGVCRVLPPRADDRSAIAVWPYSDAGDWCGSFAKPPEQPASDDDVPF